MPKSIAEMRQSEHVGLTATYPLCVAGSLADKHAALDREFATAVKTEAAESGTKRLGPKSRARELAEQLDVIAEQMAEHTVTLFLKAHSPHEWRAWKAEHPPRDGITEDKRGGLNFDALAADLDSYLVPDRCEPALGSGDWEWIVENASWGDLYAVAVTVFNLHERAVDIPKSRRDLLGTAESDDD